MHWPREELALGLDEDSDMAAVKEKRGERESRMLDTACGMYQVHMCSGTTRGKPKACIEAKKVPLLSTELVRKAVEGQCCLF